MNEAQGAGASSPEGEAQGAVKPPRPAVLTLAQSVLALEAFVAIFAMLTLWGLSRGDYLHAPLWLTFGYLPALAVLMMVAAARQKEPWGRPLGWVLQFPLLVVGLVEPSIAIIGALFLVTWVIGVRLGMRIDRERAEFTSAAGAGDAPA